MTLHPDFLALLATNSVEPTEIPTLYHGTTLTRARGIIAEGLLPRSSSGQTTMQQASGANLWLSSERECVYLSDVQAAMYAINHSIVHGGQAAVVQVALPSHAVARLLPDEDVLAAGMVGLPALKPKARKQRAQESAKASMRALRHLWPAGLAMSGVVAHEGAVAERICGVTTVVLSADEKALLSRVAAVAKQHDVEHWDGFGLGPLQRAVYEGTTAWSIGQKVDPRVVVPFFDILTAPMRAALEGVFSKEWEAVDDEAAEEQAPLESAIRVAA